MSKTITERPNGSRRVRHELSSETKTEQFHKKEVNINTILSKAFTGLVEQKRGGMYGDFTNVPSYHEAKTRVADAISDFALLPSVLRKRFDNDPAKAIEFVTDPQNLEEAINLGMVDPPSPSDVNVAPESPSEPVKETEPPAES